MTDYGKNIDKIMQHESPTKLQAIDLIKYF